MQELVRLNKSGFLPLLGAGGFWGRKETKICPGGGGRVLTLLLQQESTFSENKNFTDTRISSQNKIKDKS
jgi:hypothetical protein